MDQFLWWSGALFWIAACLVGAIFIFLVGREFIFSNRREKIKPAAGVTVVSHQSD